MAVLREEGGHKGFFGWTGTRVHVQALSLEARDEVLVPVVVDEAQLRFRPVMGIGRVHWVLDRTGVLSEIPRALLRFWWSRVAKTTRGGDLHGKSGGRHALADLLRRLQGGRRPIHTPHLKQFRGSSFPRHALHLFSLGRLFLRFRRQEGFDPLGGNPLRGVPGLLGRRGGGSGDRG
ncbi:Uncharacterised protein [Streptococcus pneumoniae]|nr:Uncharacterised protein [Streptococcus pneumoniae]